MYQTLREIKNALEKGIKEYVRLEEDAVKALASHGWQVDYVAIRGQSTLLAPVSGENRLVVLAAAKLGNTRLIDNIEVCL